MGFKLDTLGRKIGSGYLLMTIVLATAVSITIWRIKQVENLSDRVISLRYPSSQADLELLSGINHSIADLRGWVLLKKDSFRRERSYTWKFEINKALEKMEGLSKKWTNPKNVERLSVLKPKVQLLEESQKEIEEIAETNVDSAINILDTRVVSMNKEITDLIGELVVDHQQLFKSDYAEISDRITGLTRIEWLLLGIGTLVSLLLAYYLTKSISEPISEAVDVADKIGRGELGSNVELRGSVELFNLGSALNEMRSSLFKINSQQELNEWLVTGQNGLNEAMRGDKPLEVISTEIMKFMADYLKVIVGAVYVYESSSESFVLKEGYAIERTSTPERYKPGEGLVGQAAVDNQITYYSDRSSSGLRMSSILVEDIPSEVVFVPFMFEHKVLGVLELGKSENFEERERNFLDLCRESIGVFINAAQTRDRINSLLQEASENNYQLIAARHEIEQQLEGLNEVALVSVTDPDGNIFYVNDRFVEVSQFSKEELMGKNHRILKSGKQPDGIFIGMWKAISSGRVWNGEIINKAKDGTYYWVDTTIIPILNPEGKIDKYLSVRFEITKIKEQQERLQELNKELQHQQAELEQSNEELEEQTRKLKEQQEELQVANEELEEQAQIVEQKNRDLEVARTDIEFKANQLEITSKYKSEFLANMSHELRTPLNSLLILANDLFKNGEGNLTEEQVESAEIISKSGYDLLNLINEILDLSKIEAGRMELNLKECKISEIANDLKRNFKRYAEEKGLTFDVKINSDIQDESISTDRQRLDQILKNLISNALKFTEKGGVEVTFVKNAGGQLAISVKDSGIGIPKDKQNLIFEAFQQLEGGTSRKYGGTGLGLSISRELSKLLGGGIMLESEVGKGSVFTLVIPVHTTDKSNLVHENKKEEVRKEYSISNSDEFIDYPSIDDDRSVIGEKDNVLLIIEDDLRFAQILAGQARNKKFSFLSAATGEDGIKLASEYKPDAIILDIDLPGMNGHEVLAELKGNPDLRHIPVHIMSVNEKTLDPIRSGAIEYLTKPVSKEDLDLAFGRIEDFVSRKMKNLLILEDDDGLRRSIVKLIGNGDVQCFEANSGKQAMDLIENQKVDCIVLDLGLPDMNGFEFVKLLENKLEDRVPPIIIYTGKELTKEENDELRQYAESIIIKGVKSEERLLDETALFLHRTVRNLPKQKQHMIADLYDNEKVFLGKKVLLVDDDMRNIFALSKVLKERGLEVIKTDNGKSAIEMLVGNSDIDLVLMDIMMPEMDGYECMGEIRKRQEFAELPIIALTAKAMKEDRQKCIDAGASDYITKPVDVERLLSLMRIWMSK